MKTVGVGALTLLVGTFLGYFVRLTEFRREQRLQAYSDLVATFLSAAHAGAALHSLYFTFGEKFYLAENRPTVEPWWKTWADAAGQFEAAAARMRLVCSDAMLAEATKLEDFITANIRRVPPVYRTDGTEGWGESAKVGPSQVDADAVRLAREFADRGRDEVSRWRGR